MWPVIGVLALAGFANAESPCRLEIDVVDACDLALQGAVVKLDGGGSMITGKNGRVLFGGLSCDRTHEVRVSFPGLVTRRVIDLWVDDPTGLALTICLDEALTERIRFICPGPLIDPDKTSISTTLSAGFMADLPGRAGDSGERRTWKPAHAVKRCEKAVTTRDRE